MNGAHLYDLPRIPNSHLRRQFFSAVGIAGRTVIGKAGIAFLSLAHFINARIVESVGLRPYQ